MKTKLTITKPDDWHIHLRDGAALARTVSDVSKRYSRAIVMPNLKPPVTTVGLAKSYHERIIQSIPNGRSFQPLMTLYLTDKTTPAIIAEAKSSGIVFACKYYPAGATTNSEFGVTHFDNLLPICEALADNNMPLLVHGEVTDPEVDIFDREKIFIDEYLSRLVDEFPSLKIVLEHVTTHEGVQFVTEAPATVAATITAHHLLLDRNHLLVGGIRPHYYCLPVLKRRSHKESLISAATSGNPKFFLGTDSAAHSINAKECSVGCAGVYTGHASLEIYAEIFEMHNALDKFEAFASHHGPDFYGLPRNTDQITLVKEDWTVPDSLSFGDESLVPFRAGEGVGWKLVSD